MKNSERMLVGGMFTLLIFVWLGFLLHVSPRFAGSGWGLFFGVTASVLMVIPLCYSGMKRIPFLKKRAAKYGSLQMWMSVHIYVGILGALFAIIHTGHKYNSALGIALTTTMLLVIVSGFVLRYLTPFVNLDVKDKLLLLQTARGDLDSAWGVLEKSATAIKARPKTPLFAAGFAAVGLGPIGGGPVDQVTILADGVADLEYSIRTDQLLKRWFSLALKAHIALSVAMYALLAAHIASGVYFGLRGV
jgi:uncharacterized membrane protein (UPF0136 family)